ncbi:unnamed protein product [Xylocopa violacea]|uniref:SMP-30/Gluconolactonase/LRE-like region domain-containing protein n=1 Tax=Xylocopa violacea TaxID=135666 RepID=A0ABP1NS10_XYLVO
MQNIIYKILFFGLCLTFFVHGRESDEKHKDNGDVIIEPIVGRFDHSEGPHWDYHTQKLYFVDIEAQKICKFDPVTKDLSCIYIETGPVGVAVPVEGEPNKFVAGAGTDFILVEWDTVSNVTRSTPQTLAVVDTDRNNTRWNDGKVDSSGRFWGGTIGPEVNDVVVPNQASLYRIDSDFKPQRKLSPVTNSNGLAWNLQDNEFFYIDTPTLQVAAFDYEPINGTISNKRIVFDLKKNNVSGIPDGMTIDADGNLWVALYGGGGVANVDPRTDTLFVTTSSRDVNAEGLVQQPYSGYVFAVRGLGVRGLPANSFKA